VSHAEYPNPEPLEVFVDRNNPGNSIKCYIMLSMFQGDLVQQCASAKVTGHQGENGCPRCFLLATNTLSDGTDLGTLRWLGCQHPASAQVLRMPQQGQNQAQIVELTNLQFLKENADGGVFDRELAASIEISHEQHRVCARTAGLAYQNAMQQHPRPCPIPVGASELQREVHRSGTVALFLYRHP
jgi:hypothetical protein